MRITRENEQHFVCRRLIEIIIIYQYLVSQGDKQKNKDVGCKNQNKPNTMLQHSELELQKNKNLGCIIQSTT